MGKYIQAVGAAVILSALTDMLAADGAFKKYCRLAAGFMVIAVMLMPVTGFFNPTPISITEPDMEAAQAQARARVLMEHKSNLKRIIENEFPQVTAYVEVDGEGNVTKITVENASDEDAISEFAERELGADGEKVIINEAQGAD